MSVQQNKFALPTQPRSGAVRQEIIDPTKGFNSSVPPQNLRPGETPHSENLVFEGGYLLPRSGLSQFVTAQWRSNYERAALVARAYSVDGVALYIVTSDLTTNSAISDGGVVWAEMANPNDLDALGYGSASTTSYFDWAEFWNPDEDHNCIAATKGSAVPVYKVLRADSSASLVRWYEHTGFTSVESYANFVASFDQRLLFFNIAAEGEDPKAKRVRWSVRGDPMDFTSIGAGFDDLIDMKGFGTGLIPDRDRLLLFSDKELWQARARRDSYAFDFTALDKTVGAPYPRTVVSTNVGTMWVGEDFNIYRLAGNAIRPFEPNIREYLRDNLKEETEFWANYDPERETYQLYFSTTTGDVATKAFFLNTTTVAQSRRDPARDTGMWMHQDFEYGTTKIEISNGCRDFMASVQSDTAVPARYRSDETFDATSDTSFKWRSHAIRASQDPNTYEGITEFWLDYEADSAMSLDLYHTTDLGQSWAQAGTMALATGGLKTAFLPVTPIAARHSQFEIRATNTDKVRLSNMRLTLRSYSGRRAP